MPELWEENLAAWNIYMQVRNQVLVFPQYDKKGKEKTPFLELNFAAVIPVMSIFDVPQSQQRECFEKILLIHDVHQSKGIVDFLASHEGIFE